MKRRTFLASTAALAAAGVTTSAAAANYPELTGYPIWTGRRLRYAGVPLRICYGTSKSPVITAVQGSVLATLRAWHRAQAPWTHVVLTVTPEVYGQYVEELRSKPGTPLGLNTFATSRVYEIRGSAPAPGSERIRSVVMNLSPTIFDHEELTVTMPRIHTSMRRDGSLRYSQCTADEETPCYHCEIGSPSSLSVFGVEDGCLLP